MGTRAAFWVGDPADLENREWLGCVAFDGHTDNFPELINVNTESGFRKAVGRLAKRDDFADPKNGGWPYPWDKDIFLTDVTYAFINGAIQACWFHTAFAPWKDLFYGYTSDDDDPGHYNIPAPSRYDQRQPDSIIIVRRKRRPIENPRHLPNAQ